MTQEEKAKAYDEALERAKKLYEQGTITESLSYVFSELKESEDEVMRSMAIKAVHAPEAQSCIKSWGINPGDVIAWLEKQGEQKQDPCDNCKDVMLNCHNFPCVKKRAFEQGKSVLEVIKEDGEIITYSETDGYKLVEPKFKVGDWVVNKLGDAWHIDSFDGKNYQVSDGKGNYNYFPISRQDKMHHWTIQDAKAGDVLVYKENIKGSNGIKYERICLFNNFDNAFFILTTISNDVEGYDIDVNINYPDDTIPATKEQRDTLEKAMAGVGYTFDFKYKESLKTRQKPAWSEEDEKSLDALITSLNNERFYRHLKTLKGIDVNVVIDWLKSLKDRVGCEANCTTTKEWSKEDEKKSFNRHT